MLVAHAVCIPPTHHDQTENFASDRDYKPASSELQILEGYRAGALCRDHGSVWHEQLWKNGLARKRCFSSSRPQRRQIENSRFFWEMTVV